MRDDAGEWSRIESNVAKHAEAEFSHGVCPHFLKQHYPETFKKNFFDE